ncbi:MAG: protein kinase [Myxococcales bacterium]|nr:protein kinase [Myxococcales bacterium]
MNKPIPFGKYYLLERINVGGMAEVFRAKQFGVEGFERLVAVKRILPNIAEDKEFIEMFVDEAKISVQLNHANIAQVFDLGHEEGSYYIALEHIHGRDLRAIFDRNRNQGDPMPVPQACFVIMKVCEGLDYAHNKRDETGRELALVHRDVSPQNIIVSHEGEIKLIDFGIAKAAGRGSQTQAGILKGKFGYMSPEQVRGLPVDRRSDVFSCGIVLYELLTGERLFVGESDFSTLEKVRNVEILPPSTYNRKIQPELERIVLKALAKDVEDRYQNAIDLHDELQAFVYTSGEFYSRKDLAGWMKQQWSKEIKEESAKLASYRDMAPPSAAQSDVGTTVGNQEGRARTLARKTNPPPIPGEKPLAASPTAKTATPMRKDNAPDLAPDLAAKANLDWDEDELETSIYDEESLLDADLVPVAAHPPSDMVPPAMPAPAMPAPAMPAPAMPAPAMPAPAMAAAASGPTAPALTGSALSAFGVGADTVVTAAEEPDLSSLLVTAQGWEAPQATSPVETTDFDMSQTPGRVADGSNRAKAPAAEAEAGGGVSEVLRMASLAAPVAAAPSEFGPALVPQPSRKTNTLYALASVPILIAAGIIAIMLASTGGSGGSDEVAAGSTPAVILDETDTAAKPVESSGPAPIDIQASGPTVTGIANAKTGLDLIVDPVGVKVSLDGRPIGKAPLQIRSLRPGEHFIEIEAPAGYFSKSEKVTIIQDKADRVEIKLVAMEITGTFVSQPAGAEVLLVADGESQSLGNAPAKATLDPRKRYEVIFKKDGFATVTKPVAITGDSQFSVLETLSKARPSSKPVPSNLKPSHSGAGNGGAAVAVAPPWIRVEKPAPPKPRTPKPVVDSATGMLMLNAKPPCKIFIDGRDIGKMTPQRSIKLSAGKHRITLLNNELGIKESFNVKISADKPTKAFKDFTDQID